MNRRTELFDDRIADWLEDDPDRAPSAVLETVLAAMPVVAQRRPVWSLRDAWSQPLVRAAFGATLAVVVGFAFILMARPVVEVGPRQSQATPGLSQDVRSATHLYALRLPSDWRPDRALDPSTDVYSGSGGSLSIAFRVIPAASSQDEWQAAYFQDQMAELGASCLDVAYDATISVRLGNDYGQLWELPCISAAMVLVPVGDHGYDVRFSPDPGSPIDSGADSFLVSVLHTFTFDWLPATGRPPGLVPQAFTSARYGYSIGYPAGWELIEAARGLAGFEAPWSTGVAVDHFFPFSGRADLVVASAAIEPSVTLTRWTDATAVATCGPPASREAFELDGEPAELLTYAACNTLSHEWVTVLHAGRGYHILWLDQPGNEDVDRAYFEEILATFRFPPSGWIPPTESSQP
jgi:hypothetical protein